LKILHITESLGGGVYTYFKDLGDFILSKKYDENYENILIYSPNRKELDKQKLKKELSKAFCLKEVLMTREISPYRDLIALYKLFGLIKNLKPNIIHLHSSKAGVLGRMLSVFFPKVRVYYTPHGYSFVREDISRCKKNFYWIIEKGMSVIFGGTTLACGDTEFNYAKNIGPAKLIRNGVQPNKTFNFKNRINNISNREIIIGTIGRISPQKNPELFNQIALSFPDIKFVWIGEGELNTKLTSLNINITGWLNKRQVLNITNTFSIYIQTSLWEGLPFTILEAMSLGKPIVATDVIGNKDAVKNGVNGILCKNVDEFKIAITKILSDDELERKFSDNSINRINKEFNLELNFTKLFETYSNT